MKNNKALQFRLIVMNFLEFAVWGSYLICMGRYLAEHGMGTHIGIFYSIQGIVSIFMPALMGNRSPIDLTDILKSAPVASILLQKTILGT